MKTWPDAPSTCLHVEDCCLWAELVEAQLRHWPVVSYLGCAHSLCEARTYWELEPPDLLLLDLGLPDGGALPWAEELRRCRPQAKIVLCTVRADDVTLHHFERLALNGLIWKEAFSLHTLRPALAAVLAGGRYLPPELSHRRLQLRRDPQAWFKLLSDREQELLPLIASGLSDDAMADALGKGSDTIRSQRQSIMRKLCFHRTIDLLLWAQARGFGRHMAAGVAGNGKSNRHFQPKS